MTEASVPAAAGRRCRAPALAVCCLAVFMAGLDSTALNVALPAVQRELHASVAGMQWTMDAYNLMVASLILLAGSVADRAGRRRMLLLGFALFTAGSALCGLASSTGELIAFRAVQGLGGAVLAPVSLSVITHIAPDAARRARAIGAWTASFAVGMAAGPLLGGLLVAGGGWRSVFWINVPVGIAALAFAFRGLPESRAAVPRRPDPVGQLLVIALLGPLTYAVIDAPHRGALAPPVLAAAAVALAAFAGLAAYERRRAEPLIDPRFFRSVPFSGAVVISLSAFAVLGGFLFLSTLYLQDARGLSPLVAGLWTLPMPAATVAAAPLAGRLQGRLGSRTPLVLAGAALAAGSLLFAVCGTDCCVGATIAGYACIGAGIGLVDVPATHLAVDGMPAARAGVASGISTTSCRVGVSLGVAAIGAVLSAGLPGGTAPGVTAFADAARPAWWLMGACGAVVMLLGALVTGDRARRTARRAHTAGTGPSRPGRNLTGARGE
ncbi:MFS transporter [Streptomyces sp. I05A-00742]|uniref:MFS transporter n=1 Tax=Streptomyces sp. I05A-00742 TaxID=2732853 RepID=UPI00289B3447|nr:MFS transporter [Streptomyces sp. I05A-00742]